jgi:hypothetical protein
LFIPLQVPTHLRETSPTPPYSGFLVCPNAVHFAISQNWIGSAKATVER